MASSTRNKGSASLERLRLVRELLLLFVPIIVAVAAFGYITVTFAQSTEIFRRFIEVTKNWLEIAFLAFALLFLSFQLFSLCKRRAEARVTATMFEVRGNPFQSTLVPPDAFPALTATIISSVASSPIVCFLAAFMIVAPVPPSTHLRLSEPVTAVLIGATIATILLSLLYGIISYRGLLYTRLWQDRVFRTADELNSRQLPKEEQTKYENWSREVQQAIISHARENTVKNAGMLVMMTCAYIVITASYLYSAMHGDEISPLTAVSWAFAILAGIYSYLDVMPTSERSAIFAGLLLLALICHVLLSGVVSEIRSVAGRSADYRSSSDRGNASLTTRFREWLSSRPDIDRFRAQGRKYPVFIVTAQGGGVARCLSCSAFACTPAGSVPSVCNPHIRDERSLWRFPRHCNVCGVG
jgi:hypothetical protein